MPWLAFARRSEDQGEWNATRLLNWFPRIDARAAGEVLLKQHPGLTEWSSAPDPVRAMIATDGALYAVVRSYIRKTLPDGTGGAVGGALFTPSDNPTMATDGLSVVTESNGDYYVLDIAANTLSKLSITGLNSVTSVTFLNQRIIVSGRGGGRADRMHCSDPLDATTFQATAFATAEAEPDKLLRVLAVGNVLWALGSRTVEPLYDSGTGDFPFVPYGGAASSIGLKSKLAATGHNRTLYFVGNDNHVYRMDGFQPTRISTPGVVAAMGAVGSVRCFMYEAAGHTFLAVRPSGKPAWLYDVTTGLWHERSSGLGESQWHARASALFKIDGFDSPQQIVGAWDGSFYRVDETAYADGPDVLRRYAVSEPVTRDGRFTVSRLEARMATGTADIGRQPKIELYTSDNGEVFGRQWTRDLGLIGDRDRRVIFNGLGSYDGTFYGALEVTDPVRADVYGVSFEAA